MGVVITDPGWATMTVTVPPALGWMNRFGTLVAPTDGAADIAAPKSGLNTH